MKRMPDIKNQMVWKDIDDVDDNNHDDDSVNYIY